METKHLLFTFRVPLCLLALADTKRSMNWVLVLTLGLASLAQGQKQSPLMERPGLSDRGDATRPGSETLVSAGDNQSAVRRFVKFSGVLTDFAGKPLSGEVQVTFTLYKEETDEEPLWTETQKLAVDTRGCYTALLGATQDAGIPVQLFGADEARWLGVQVDGQPQQPRTLLVSVPYALKAVDAEKLAGKSVSDFVLSESLGEQVRQVIQEQGQGTAQPTLAGTSQQRQTGTSSTAKRFCCWDARART